MTWLAQHERAAERGLIVFWTMAILLRASAVDPTVWARTDSSVFAYVGTVIAHGGAPYVDTFDHKGPLIYLFNWMAMELGSWRAIALFEAPAIAIALFYTFRIARLRASFLASTVIVSIFTFLFYRNAFDGGNLTEEYALPWIAMASFFFLRQLQCGVLRARHAFLIGFGLAMVVLLRPNMVGAWLVGIPVLLWNLRREGRAAWVLRWGLAGFAAGFLPFVLWLSSMGALAACWDVYILFNLEYTARMSAGHAFDYRITSFARFFVEGTMEVTALCAYAMWRRPAPLDRTAQLSLVMLDVSLVTVCLSGMPYGHYSMVLYPLLVYPAAYFAEYLERFAVWYPAASWTPRLAFLTLLFLLVNMEFCVSSWRKTPELVPEHEAVDYIRTHTTPDDRIAVWGNRDVIYTHSQRLSASRYSYATPLVRLDPEIANAYFAGIEQAPPPIFIVHLDEAWNLPSTANERFRTFLQTYGYHRINLKDNRVIELYERPHDEASASRTASSNENDQGIMTWIKQQTASTS